MQDLQWKIGFSLWATKLLVVFVVMELVQLELAICSVP